MKKRVLVLLLVSMLALVGCGSHTKSSDDKKSDTKPKVSSEDVTTEAAEVTKDDEPEKNVTEAASEDENAVSIADEMADVEKASLEFENANWDIPQQEMDAKAYEWYTLWDDELNSLWNRLMNCLPNDEKEKMSLAEQDWVNRKQKNVIAAGVPAYGGSLQPLLENTMAKDMTRKQAYYLASCLAEAKGESYTIPEEVANSYGEIDMSLDAIFSDLSGTYPAGNDIEICVTKVEDSDYTADNFPEGTKWLTWYSHSDILTDADVYAYTKDTIVFYKGSMYYVLQKGFEGEEVTMSVGSGLTMTEIVGR